MDKSHQQEGYRANIGPFHLHLGASPSNPISLSNLFARHTLYRFVLSLPSQAKQTSPLLCTRYGQSNGTNAMMPNVPRKPRSRTTDTRDVIPRPEGREL